VNITYSAVRRRFNKIFGDNYQLHLAVLPKSKPGEIYSQVLCSSEIEDLGKIRLVTMLDQFLIGIKNIWMIINIQNYTFYLGHCIE